MIVCRAQPVAALWIVASATILRCLQMASGFAGGNRTVVALGTPGELGWQCDVTQRSEAAVIHRRQRKTPARRVTIPTALAGCRRVNIDENLRSSGRALNGYRDGRSRGIHEAPRMRAVMAVRALLAGDIRRGMVDEPAHECRSVVAVAAIGGWTDRYVTRNHACCAQSIVTGLTRDGVPRQYPVIEHTAHVERGGVMAAVARLSNVSRIGVRIRR